MQSLGSWIFSTAYIIRTSEKSQKIIATLEQFEKIYSSVLIYVVSLLPAVFSSYCHCGIFYFLNGTSSNADFIRLFHFLVCHSVYMFLSIRFILVVMVILHLTPKLGFLLYTHILTSISWGSIHSILSNAV